MAEGLDCDRVNQVWAQRNVSNDYIANVCRAYWMSVEFEKRIGVVVPSIFAVVVVLGLVGNSLVIFIISYNRQMRNSTNTLIIGLALSDLLFLTFCVPFTAVDYVTSVWIFPDWWCPTMNYLQFIAAYASVWTLVLLAFDRFLAVVYPIVSITLRTMRNAAMTLVVLWSVVAILCLPVGFQYSVHEYFWMVEIRSTCAIPQHITRNATVEEVLVYFLSFNVLGFALPVTIICVLYYLMMRRLWLTTKPGSTPNRTNNAGKSVNRRIADSFRAKKKVARMVLGVILTFIFCWLPLNMCFMYTALSYPPKSQSKTGIIIQICSQVLAYTNSCLNPILYAFLSDNFRKEFKRIFRSICCLCVTSPAAKHTQIRRQEVNFEVTVDGGTVGKGGGGFDDNTPPNHRRRGVSVDNRQSNPIEKCRNNSTTFTSVRSTNNSGVNSSPMLVTSAEEHTALLRTTNNTPLRSTSDRRVSRGGGLAESLLRRLSSKSAQRNNKGGGVRVKVIVDNGWLNSDQIQESDDVIRTSETQPPPPHMQPQTQMKIMSAN